MGHPIIWRVPPYAPTLGETTIPTVVTITKDRRTKVSCSGQNMKGIGFLPGAGTFRIVALAPGEVPSTEPGRSYDLQHDRTYT